MTMEAFKDWHKKNITRSVDEKAAGPVTWEKGESSNASREREDISKDALVDAPSDNEKVYRDFTEEFRDTFKLESAPAELVTDSEAGGSGDRVKSLDQKE